MSRWMVTRNLITLTAAFSCLLAPRIAAAQPPSGGAPTRAVVAPDSVDALDEALAVAGLTRADLGWEPRGFWERYPEDIPYKLRHLDAIVSEPLSVVPFTRMMGATLMQSLSPENLASKAAPGALYRAVHDIGVNKRYGAMRSYSANLVAGPTPLADALLACWGAGDRKTKTMTFGNASDVAAKAEIEKQTAAMPPELSGICGKLVLDLLDARHWADLAFRNVPLEQRARIAARIDIGEEMTDGNEYEPAFDDAAHAWDEASLWYAGLKTVEALDLARHALADTLSDVKSAGELTDLRIDIDTPVGRVLIDGTGAHDLAIGDGAFLVLDLGGNDRYTGALGASTPLRSIGAALDFAGDDTYAAKDVALGAGLCGIGVLLDARGNDSYASERLAQGGAQFGLGALLDLAGEDRYSNHFSGQGAGCFGVGLLFDLGGRDEYTIWGDGQGYATAGGVGVLADREGDDSYLAVVDPAITGHPSAHSENKISASGAQGCGMGRRGDGSDGHSWAGGLGVILDGTGNDSYTIGNWGQGCGYWFGTGLMWDGAGNDTYHGTGWTSASGAHFAVGAVIDESGDDLHSNAQNWGPAYGHDFVVSVLYDGSGNDVYECGAEGVGHSINRSVVLCLDGGGDDRYVFKMKDRHPGLTTYDARFLARTGTSIYWSESTSLGLFLDTGGNDVYPEGFTNGMVKTDEPGSDTVKAHNRAVFVDRPDGKIDVDRPLGGHRR